VTINEGESGREWLGQTDGSIINCTISVGVQFTHYLTDDSGAFNVTLIWAKTHFEHHVQDTALNWL
jgi:hypothetical protein